MWFVIIGAPIDCEHRMAWGKITWSRHGGKHFSKVGLDEWPAVVQGTNENNKVSKYSCMLKETEIQELEELAVAHRIGGDGNIELIHGRPIYPDGDFSLVYIVCSRMIGASRGKLTNIVLVQWDEVEPGTVHGYPVSEQELKRELSDNPQEWEYYLRWQKAVQESVT